MHVFYVPNTRFVRVRNPEYHHGGRNLICLNYISSSVLYTVAYGILNK